VRCLKVAFGMEDEKMLTEAHYGDSNFFLIYKICDDGSIELLEKRENKAKTMREEDERHGDPGKFRAIINQLEEVDVLAAFRMGPNFLRIKDKTNKVVFFTRTRDLESAIRRVVEHFEELLEEVREKKSKT